MADELEDTETRVFDPDAGEEVAPEPDQPRYRIYANSRIPVGAGVGKMWKDKLDGAVAAYQTVYEAWDQVLKYYNNDQTKAVDTPRGVFKRGDSTENVLFSNVNVLLPAVYSKNPDIACNSEDKEDEAFVKSLQKVLNALFKRKDKLAAKSKFKRMAGFTVLTDMGVVKLDWTLKDDSREAAYEAVSKLAAELAKAKDIKEVEEIEGKIQALEQQMYVRDGMGPKLFNVLPHNLICDPYAEQDDALDGNFMFERCYIATALLKARFTDEKEKSVYKPTHKVSFQSNEGVREDGLGMVLTALDSGTNVPVSYTEQERLAFIEKYYTECYYVWDKTTRRVMLFQRDDWKWPIWVWDDPLKLTRFFPYFVAGFTFSTGSVTRVGETSYMLDQQDEINDINRKVSRIRRSIFDFWFFNSDLTDEDQVKQFVKAIKGETSGGDHMVGVKAGERKLGELIMPFLPDFRQAEAFFDKGQAFNAINRISNVNEGLRGVQFKTNTNEAAVNTYQDSMRISIGSKVDVLEDVIADVAQALAELCVQHLTTDDVANLVGAANAAGWEQMGVAEFNSRINVDIVAGSLEKATSIFRKKEAIEISQSIGQFAQAAPGAAMRIVLRLLEQSFTQVNIKPEDWEALDSEITANLQRGNSTGGSGDVQDIEKAALNLPPEAKAKIAQMAQQGVPPEQIKAQILQLVEGQGNGIPAPAKQQQQR